MQSGFMGSVEGGRSDGGGKGSGREGRKGGREGGEGGSKKNKDLVLILFDLKLG